MRLRMRLLLWLQLLLLLREEVASSCSLVPGEQVSPSVGCARAAAAAAATMAGIIQILVLLQVRPGEGSQLAVFRLRLAIRAARGFMAQGLPGIAKGLLLPPHLHTWLRGASSVRQRPCTLKGGTTCSFDLRTTAPSAQPRSSG
jgi:hypothetical protein